MRLAVDTNVLLRVVLKDDADQAAMAERLLTRADRLIISTVVLCELVWTLRSQGYSRADIAVTVDALVDPAKVETDRAVVEAGLEMLRRGGDFADGCIIETARREDARLATFDQRLAKPGDDGAIDVGRLL